MTACLAGAGLGTRRVEAATRMTVPEVIQLVKAGVSDNLIMRQVRSTGTRLTLAVADILKLKEAGASDELLEALMQTSDAPATGPAAPMGPVVPPLPTTGSLRTWRETTADGDVVIHVTNLDETGRRIGGELPPGPPEPRREAASWSDRPEREDQRAPVIVNVYPPAAAQPGAGGGYEPAGRTDPGGYLGGRYPGYLTGLGGYGYCRSCPRPHPGGHHGAAGFEAGLFSRPSAIDTRPYRSQTAARRNRQSFGGN